MSPPFCTNCLSTAGEISDEVMNVTPPMRISPIPYLLWLPLLTLLCAGPGLADDAQAEAGTQAEAEAQAEEQQIAAELRAASASEDRIDRQLDRYVEKVLAVAVEPKFARQDELLRRRYLAGWRASTPTNLADR